MSKIRGKDFAKTVVITPEESESIIKKAANDRRTGADRRKGVDRRVEVTLKRAPKRLSGWSIFFLLVVAVVASVGIVAVLMHFNILPGGQAFK
jgi:hypothetical protein